MSKEEDKEIIADLFQSINKIAKILGIEENGFRVINNCGEDAGQEVEGGENVLEFIAAQKGHDVRQLAADAVRIGVEHHAHGIPIGHSYPSISARYWA